MPTSDPAPSYGFDPTPNPPLLVATDPNVSLPPPPRPHAPNAGCAGAPPRYTRVMSRYNLRWPLILSSALGAIWAIASGVYSIKDMGNDGETAKEKVIDLLLGILYFVVGGIECFAIFVAAFQNVKLAKSLLLAAPIGCLVAVAAQIIDVIGHYTLKGDRINQCVKEYTGATSYDRFGNIGTVDENEARRLCDDSWSRGTWRVFAWLIVVSLFAIFFAGIAMSYYRQLQNPTAPANQSIPLQQYANNPPPPQNNYWGPPPAQQQSWMVPPYPGPPPPGQEPFEKGDYQPAAEWAQAGYAPPSGAPPSGGSRDFGAHQAEEEAWERARTGGVTAHLTGHGPNTTNRDSGDQGYAIGNREEDEAWERARGEGITAHLTGHQKPRRDHEEV